MRSPSYRRIAIWLCLLAALGLAIMPTRAFVLCVRASGEVSLEAELDGRCAECGDACCGTRQPSPEQECQACCGDPAPTVRADHECSCLDVALPSQADARTTPQELHRATAELPVGILVGVPAPLQTVLLRNQLRAERPFEHPPPCLRSVRSVVLLI